MIERPILFSAAMVRALLDGSKTQTRRIVKPQPPVDQSLAYGPHHPTVIDRHGDEQPGQEVFGVYSLDGEWSRQSPYGTPGDRLIPAMPLPSYDKRYCVDVFGDVWSRAKGGWKRLKPGITSKGYCTITPARNGRYATQSVHQLVCEAFYGATSSGLDQVRHLNGEQSDNAPENLDWGTQEQNWLDRAAHGGGMGEAHHNAKLTRCAVAEIRASSKSQRTLSKEYGVTQSSIQAARTGATWVLDRKPAPPNMPRWASRITLEIVSVRVERLNDCSEVDALAEGVTIDGSHQSGYCAGEFLPPSIRAYRELWESINGAGSWATNPWVLVIEFKRVLS